jgi:hypothetical protein
MAEVVEQAPRAYPCWLYNQEQGAVVVENADQEAALQGTWYDSPAAFGVETHPSVTPMLPVPGLVAAGAPAPDALVARLDDLTHRMQQVEAQLTHLHTLAAPAAEAPARSRRE